MLEEVQKEWFNTPFNQVLEMKEKDLLSKYVELSVAEEPFKKQKSRVKWLALGDQNTKKKKITRTCAIIE